MVVVYFVVVALMGIPAHGQNIAWGSAMGITGDANFATSGGYFDALIPNTSVATLTADGMTFHPAASLGGSAYGDGKISYTGSGLNNFGWNNFPTTTPSSPAFAAVMNAGGTFQSGSTGTGTVTISGLTPGDNYVVQVFNYASDGDHGNTTLSGSTPVTLENLPGDGGAGTYGEFATGTFTAAGTTESFNWTGAGASGQQYTVIGSIVVRDVAPVLPPTLSQDTTPPSAVAYLNSTSTFTAFFSGKSPIGYQWLVSTNGGVTFTNVAGATNTTLTLTNNQLVTNVQYYLRATNTYGTNHSSAATLTVVLPPSPDIVWGSATGITGDANLLTNGVYFDALMPNSGISPAPVADGITFNVAVSLVGGGYGDSKISYAGSGISTFGWPNSFPVSASASQAFATVMDDGGIFQNGGSGSGTVTISQLVSGHRYAVQVFNFAADGDAGLTTLSGATTVTLSNLGNGQFATGLFTASGGTEAFNWNGAGSAYTVLGAISVSEITAVATIAPTNVVNQGDSATISVNAFTSLPSYYQWLTDNGSGGMSWSGIAGANGSNYVVNTTGLVPGSYKYEVIVTNSALNVTSAPVNLTVLAPSGPVVLQNPMPVTTSRYTGQGVAFTAAFGGNQPLTYQWQVSTNGTLFQDISGATNNVLTLNNLQFTNAGSYRLMATNYLGSTPSGSATLTVQPWSAAHIQWAAPVPFLGLTAGQILTNVSGSYLEGAGFFLDSFIEITAGSQQFTFRSDGVSASLAGPDFYNGEFVTNATYGSGALGTNTTGDPNFDSALNQYFDSGATNFIAVHHLIVGQQYAVQLFAVDNRTGMAGNLVNFSDPTDTNDVSATFAMGDNSYLIGTFTATGTDQVIRENLLTGGFGNINAVVVRALSYTPAVKPSVVVQPRQRNSLSTDSASFPVVTDGAPTPAYRWKAGPVGGPYTNLTDNAKFTGTVTPALSVWNLTTNDVMEFVLTMTNSAGGTVSQPVDLQLPVVARPAPSAAPIKITCVGASDVSSPTPYGTPNWPDYITSMLGYEYTINNEGASGTTMIKLGNSPYWSTAQYTAGLASSPDVVIIMLGSNDSKPYNWIYQTNYVLDYETLINQYRNLPSHPRIYLNTLLTVYGPGSYDITDPIVTGELCPMIKQIAFDEGLPLIDVNAATKNMPQNFPDNVHPNIAGAQVVAQTVFNGLMNAGETPPIVSQALNRPVVASSVADGTTAASAVDGDFTTRWSSAHTDNEWIYVDLGTVMHVTGVYLNWESAYATAYKIQVSNNALNWTDAYSTTNGAGGIERITLAADGRYVRMLGIQRATTYGYSLWDFTVIATALSPALNVAASVQGGLGLMWPTSTVPFVLQSATNLTPPINWIPATNVINTLGGSNTVAIPPTGGNVYFRLSY